MKKNVMKCAPHGDAPTADMVLTMSDPKCEKETAKQIVKSGVFSGKHGRGPHAFCAISR